VDARELPARSQSTPDVDNRVSVESSYDNMNDISSTALGNLGGFWA